MPLDAGDMDVLQHLVTLFYWYLRPLIKGFLRLTTRLCELQRICYGEKAGGPRSLGVERSLNASRTQQIREVCRTLDSKLENGDFEPGQDGGSAERQRAAFDAAINVILAVKKIKRDLHKQFVTSLRQCLRQIWGYKQLLREVERLRSEIYDADNLEHERQLLQLWSLLQPGIPLLTRKTKQWQNIGFQGEDPKTDFRGMGILGLENLLYFAREYNSAAKHILSHSHHPKHGYSFAIVGINLTAMAFRLLNDGCAKSHLFNVSECPGSGSGSGSGSGLLHSGHPELRHFHHFYSYLFIEFDKFWLSEKPRDIMEFNRIRDMFENNIRTLLSDSAACLKINVAVDTV